MLFNDCIKVLCRIFTFLVDNVEKNDEYEAENAENWTTVYESEGNDLVHPYIKLEEPVLGQFVRISFTNWDEAIYPALCEITVFGNNIAKPAK